MKKITALVLMTIIAIMTLSSCNIYANRVQDITPSEEAVREKAGLYGFIVRDNAMTDTYIAMYSFLTAANDIGINAKLYKFTDEESLSQQTDKAIADECDAVLFYAPDNDITSHIDKVNAAQRKTAVYGGNYANAGMRTNIDDSVETVIKSMKGNVLLYTSKKTDGGNVFVRTQTKYADAANELSAYLKEHTDIDMIYAEGENNARPATLAAKDAGRDIKVFGYGITDTNISMFDSGMTALSFKPVYEAIYNTVLSMQKLTANAKTEDIAMTLVISYKSGIEKYDYIQKTALEKFGVR